MNKSELVNKLASEFNLPAHEVELFVDNVFASIAKALSKDKNVNISEFGKFKASSGEVFFSPVKKLAYDVNYRYNNLEPVVTALLDGGRGKKTDTRETDNEEVEAYDIVMGSIEKPENKFEDEIVKPDEKKNKIPVGFSIPPPEDYEKFEEVRDTPENVIKSEIPEQLFTANAEEDKEFSKENENRIQPEPEEQDVFVESGIKNVIVVEDKITADEKKTEPVKNKKQDDTHNILLERMIREAAEALKSGDNNITEKEASGKENNTAENEEHTGKMNEEENKDPEKKTESSGENMPDYYKQIKLKNSSMQSEKPVEEKQEETEPVPEDLYIPPSLKGKNILNETLNNKENNIVSGEDYDITAGAKETEAEMSQSKNTKDSSYLNENTEDSYKMLDDDISESDMKKLVAERRKILEEIRRISESSYETIYETGSGSQESAGTGFAETEVTEEPEIMSGESTIEPPLLKEDLNDEKGSHINEDGLITLPADKADEINEPIEEPEFKGDILIPEDIKSLHEEIESAPKQEESLISNKDSGKTHTSYSDIFEKTDAEKEEPVTPPPSPAQEYKQPSYTVPAYEPAKQGSGIMKPLLITAAIVAVFFLGIYWMYSSGVFNSSTQNNQTTQNQQNTTQKTQPPITTSKEQNNTTPPTTTPEKKEEPTAQNKTTESNTTADKKESTTNPSNDNAPEVLTFDASKNVAFVQKGNEFYVQTASVKEKGVAEQMAKQLTKKGFNSLVVSAEIPGKGTYYRVRIGKFSSMEEAKTEAGKL